MCYFSEMDLENRSCKGIPNSEEWVSGDGRVFFIPDMSTEHLLNIVRSYKGHNQRLNRVYFELDRRGVDACVKRRNR